MATEKWATVRMEAKLLEEQNFGFCKEIDIGVVQANRSWSHSCWACYCSAPRRSSARDETTRTTHRIGRIPIVNPQLGWYSPDSTLKPTTVQCYFLNKWKFHKQSSPHRTRRPEILYSFTNFFSSTTCSNTLIVKLLQINKIC